MSQQCTSPEQFHLNFNEHTTADLVAPTLQNAVAPVAIFCETNGTHEGYALTQLNANR